MSTGQIVGGVVGAVIGYVASGFNPVGAFQSAQIPGGFISLADTTEVRVVDAKQEGEAHEHS